LDALREQHDILAQQLGDELVYFALLATLTWDRFSVDALLTRRIEGALGANASPNTIAGKGA
jgi:hypothetical protein